MILPVKKAATEKNSGRKDRWIQIQKTNSPAADCFLQLAAGLLVARYMSMAFVYSTITGQQLPAAPSVLAGRRS